MRVSRGFQATLVRTKCRLFGLLNERRDEYTFEKVFLRSLENMFKDMSLCVGAKGGWEDTSASGRN